MARRSPEAPPVEEESPEEPLFSQDEMEANLAQVEAGLAEMYEDGEEVENDYVAKTLKCGGLAGNGGHLREPGNVWLTKAGASVIVEFLGLAQPWAPKVDEKTGEVKPKKTAAILRYRGGEKDGCLIDGIDPGDRVTATNVELLQKLRSLCTHEDKDGLRQPDGPVLIRIRYDGEKPLDKTRTLHQFFVIKLVPKK